MTYPVNIEAYIEEIRKTYNRNESRENLLRELLATANKFYESGLTDRDCVGLDLSQAEATVAEFEKEKRKMRPRARAYAELIELEFRKAYNSGCADRAMRLAASRPA